MSGRTGLVAAALLVIGAAASAQTEASATVQPLAVTAPSEAGTRTLSTSYDASWTGMSAAQITVAVSMTHNAYSATANLKPSGLTSITNHLRKSTTYTAQSRGVFGPDGGALPAHYNHHGGKKNRQVSVDFAPREVQVSATPIFGSMGDPAASAAQRREAVDSLTAIVSLISATPEDACTQSLKIFDGRARYNLNLSPAGAEQVKVGGYQGTATKCTITYKRVAGFEKKKDEKPLFDKPVSIWFAPTSNGLMAPAKVAVDSNWGPITITLKSMAVS
jgi:hypothetical protein